MTVELNTSLLEQQWFSGISVPPSIPKQTPDVRIEPNRVIFTLGGKERWIIDPEQLDGNPTFNVNQSNDRNSIIIKLEDVNFPGTNLPADFTCEITDLGKVEPKIRLTLMLGGFKGGIVPLAKWLSGAKAITGQIQFNEKIPVCSLGEYWNFCFRGSAKLEVFPGWIFKVIRERTSSFQAVLTEFNSRKVNVSSNSLVFGIPASGDASLFALTPVRRTMFSLQQTDHPSWLIPWKINLPRGLELDSLGVQVLYEALHLEATSLAYGIKEQAFVAQTVTNSTKLKVQNIQLPLRELKYAMGFEMNNIQSALLGRFSAKPEWHTLSGSSLLLGDGPGSSFTLIARNKRIEHAIVAPALLSFAAPLSDIVVEAIPTKPFNVLGIYPIGDGRHPGFSKTEDLGLPALQFDPKLKSPILVMSDLSFSLLRSKDLMSLRFAFINMEFRSGGGEYAHLKKVSAETPSYMIVYFSPQHISEEAFAERNGPYPEPPVNVRMSGPSRLVFRLPETVSSLPYTLEALLNWRHYEQSVVPTAMPSSVSPNTLINHLTGYSIDETNPLLIPELPGKETTPPAPEYTAIEAPYRLILSPNWFSGWGHSSHPITIGGLTELWHTRLGVRTIDGVDEHEASLRTVRAIWQKDDKTQPFTTSLNTDQRNAIINKSSSEPQAVQVNHMILSSLGAWLDLLGNWPEKAGELSNWTHKSAMGRDNFVQTIFEGYLFPFGHRAAKIRVTERRFEPSANPDKIEMVSYLVSWEIVVVREPKRSFPAPGMPDQGRQFPFRSVELKTLRTPHIDVKNVDDPWLTVQNQDILFHAIGEDQEGRTIEFTTPFAFVSNFDPSRIQNLINEFNLKDTNANRRNRDMNGQKLAFASSNQPGDTEYVTNKMMFGATETGKNPTGNNELPGYCPVLIAADVTIPAIEQVTNTNAKKFDNTKNLIVNYHQTYLQSSFDLDQNPGEVFLTLKDKVKKGFPGDMAGGIVTPDLSVKGLSRTYGPVVTDQIGKCIDPCTVLGEAKLLGGILLKKIVCQIDIFKNPNSIPKLTTRKIYPEGREDRNALPIAIETRYTFEPQLQSDGKKLFEVTNNSAMKISAVIYTDLVNNEESKFDVSGEISNFKVNLIGTDQTTYFLTLHFNKLNFHAQSGKKPVVTPKIENVEFGGALKFVNSLQSYLKSEGENLGIAVTPNGAIASSIIAIPDISLGMLSLQNITFISQFLLPFDDSPATFYFAFASRENPFLLTVGTFGGGGFFGIMLSLDEKNPVKMLEASLEFGGNHAIDLGAASGSLYLMAGIYYRMEIDEQSQRTCQLTGYVRCGGALRVLGLITISAEFYLSLNYRDSGNAWGQASLTVKVHLVLHSKTVKLTAEKQFSGSNQANLISDMISKKDWIEYCQAFS
ncbi:hypothetical protein [Paenibacillus sp. O199]|uniref:hypothetical protein n=1 Tax=Paenibacillus sp. O199 TaxID=1643925 RepID=UPI0007BEE109|nr:hypothetical protein [Paenibacillus sp. O199]